MQTLGNGEPVVGKQSQCDQMFDVKVVVKQSQCDQMFDVKVVNFFPTAAEKIGKYLGHIRKKICSK